MNMYNSLFDMMPVQALVLDVDAPDYTIIDVNKAYLDALKIEKESIIGKSTFDVFTDNQENESYAGVQSLKKSLNNVIQTQEVDEIRSLRYDIFNTLTNTFEERHWHIINTPIFEGDKISAILNTVIDITEAVQHSKSIESANKKISSRDSLLTQSQINLVKEKDFSEWIITNLPATFFLVSESEKMLRWNKNFESITEYSESEIKKMSPIDFFQDSDKGVVLEAIKEIFQEGSVSIEVPYLTKSGNLIPHYFTASSIKHKGQNCFIGYGIDMTERVEAEKEFARTKLKYQELVESVDGIVWEADINSNSFNFVSDQAQRILGYPVTEWLREPNFWQNHIHPDDKKRIVAYSNEQSHKGENHHLEYRMLAADGSVVWISDIISVIMRDGKPDKLRGMMIDISKQKELHDERDIALRNLNERIKELQCLHNISNIEDKFTDVSTILEQAVQIIPEGWKYPESAVAEITYNNKVFQSSGYKETKWRQKVSKEVTKDQDLQITICYIEEKPALDDGPFLKEEKDLLQSILDNLVLNISKIETTEELVHSRSKLKKIMDQSLDMITTIDVDGRFIDVSEASKSLIGYSPNELRNSKFIDYVHPEDVQRTADIALDIMKGKSVTNFENSYICKDGSVIPLVWSARWDENDQLMYAVARDASEKQRAEKKQKKRSEFIEATLQNLPIGIAVHKISDGKNTLVNKKFSEIYGWKPDKIGSVEMFFENVYPDEEYRRKIFTQVMSDMESGDPDRMSWEDVQITTEQGEKRIVNAKNIPLYDQDLMISTVVDVTEKVESEDLLLYKTILIQAIAYFSSTLLAYDDWTKALNEGFEIVGNAIQADRVYYFENEFDPQTGAGKTSMLLEWVADSITPEVQNKQNQNVPFEDIREIIDPLAKDKMVDFVIEDLPECNIKEVALSQNIKSFLMLPIFIKRKFRGFIGFDDCTRERKWTEEEKQFLESIAINLTHAIENKEADTELESRAKQLAISNEELEQFAFVASHDLQEPLRMITSFLRQLEKRYGDVLDERAQKYIYYATDGAIRMRQIILDLLDYSRVEKMNKDFEKVNLEELLNEVIALNRRKINETGAVINWDKKLPEITAARYPIQQLFMNIIGNALMYVSGDDVPKIEISVKERKNCWEFSISDNGIGIQPEYHEKIFTIFQRLHSKDEYPGTGMGLAICKKIVEQHGGKIWIQSKVNEGTTFYFTIQKDN